MTSELKVDKVSPATGTSTTLGDSGDTFTVPSGVTLDTSSSTLSLPSSVITGQTEKTTLVDADKFLISDSAASGALKYVQKSNLPSGGFVYVGGSESSSSTAAVTLDNVFSSTYRAYKVIGMIAPSVDAYGKVRFRSGGSDVNSSDYKKMERTTAVDNSNNVTQHNYAANYASTFFDLGAGDINSDFNADYLAFDLTVTDPHTDIFARAMVTGTLVYAGNNKIVSGFVGVGMSTNPNADGIKFETNTGTITYHSIRIYGMVNS
jgi:hypothetical protein